MIGDGQPCFIVAEIGENPLGNVDLACAMIVQAANAGADAVKFQTCQPEELYNPSDPDIVECAQVELDRSDYPRLVEAAAQNNVILFSTPFDEPSSDFLDALGVPLFKIGSGELTHHQLLRHIAQKGKPMIISTGAAELGWIEAAVQVVKAAGNEQILVTHCSSVYPTPVELANVRAVTELRLQLNLLTGYSDHTMDPYPAIAAVSLGACYLEKHFTISRALPEGDNSMSTETQEFRLMVQGIRSAEASLGSGIRSVLDEERLIETQMRRGVYARRTIRKGQKIAREDLAIRRPLGPIPADQGDQVLGRSAASEIPAESALSWGQISPQDA